jgi:hypothetical protein
MSAAKSLQWWQKDRGNGGLRWFNMVCSGLIWFYGDIGLFFSGLDGMFLGIRYGFNMNLGRKWT